MPQDIKFKKNDLVAKENKSNSTQILTCITNMIYFGLGIGMLVIGFLYLSVYKYEFSFTKFHPTLMSGIFISFGLLIITMAILNIIFIQLNQRIMFFLIAIFSVVILILFIIILSLGIWGLDISTNSNSLTSEARSKMLQTIKFYDYNDAKAYETLAMNWLQTEFKCCGVDTSGDWRLFCNGYGNFNNNQYNNIVPDSCCIRPFNNCGKQPNTGYQNLYQSIYNNGCLLTFIHQLKKDILFIAAFSVTISCLVIILWIIHAALFYVFRRRN